MRSLADLVEADLAELFSGGEPDAVPTLSPTRKPRVDAIPERKRRVPCRDCDLPVLLTEVGFTAWEAMIDYARHAKLEPPAINRVTRCDSCAVQYRARREEDGAREQRRARALLGELKDRGELAPEDELWLRARGWAPAMETIRKKRAGGSARARMAREP